MRMMPKTSVDMTASMKKRPMFISRATTPLPKGRATKARNEPMKAM